MDDQCAAQGVDPQDDALSMLTAWRERGARRVDPVQFDFLEALARRTALCDGAARRLLDEKLTRAMARYREACGQAGCVLDGEPEEMRSQAQRAPQAPRQMKVTPATPGALAQLLAQLEASRQEGVAADVPPSFAPPAAGGAKKASSKGAQGESAMPAQRTGQAQEALAYFRRTWTRLDARRRLAQSQASLPVNAGPLNSQQLVHRALTLMQGAAPGYLHQLMSYVDALSALEPFQPGAVAAPVEPARGESRGSGASRKTGRNRRG